MLCDLGLSHNLSEPWSPESGWSGLRACWRVGLWPALSKLFVPAILARPCLAPPSSCRCSRDGGLARGSPGSRPLASLRAHRLGTDKVTGCRPHPPSPDGRGQVWACPLGPCQAVAKLIPVAPCQEPGGWPRGDITLAWVGAVGRVGSGFPAPPPYRRIRVQDVPVVVTATSSWVAVSGGHGGPQEV